MKCYKEQTVKTSILDHMKCDLCGSISRKADWSLGNFGVEETHISYIAGKCYPECSYGTEYSVDICPECFLGKLIPWLKSQGVDVQGKDYSQ